MKRIPPQSAAVTTPACATIRAGVVAAVRHGIIHAEGKPQLYDPALAQMLERGTDIVCPSFVHRFRTEPRTLAERFNELGTAVGIT